MDFSTWLKRALDAQDLSVRAFAVKSGLSRQTVYTWLSGDVEKPDTDNCKLVAAALDLPLAEVLQAAGHIEPDPDAPLDAEEAEIVQLSQEFGRAIRGVPSVFRAVVLKASIELSRSLRSVGPEPTPPTPPSPLNTPDQGRVSKNRRDVKRSRGPRDGDLGLCKEHWVPVLDAA